MAPATTSKGTLDLDVLATGIYCLNENIKILRTSRSDAFKVVVQRLAH